MQNKTERIVVVGTGETAEMAYEYFTHDSPCTVVAFSVEKAYVTKDTLFGLPVVPFEQVETLYDPGTHRMFAAISPVKLNTVRARLYAEGKGKGYRFVSYVSSRAFVWHDVRIGENCLILEQNVLQHGVSIGHNVVLWSGNHIGHQSTIRDHCFLSSQVVISGFCDVGESCFFGVNSCIANNLTIAKNCVIGMGAVVTADTSEGEVYPGHRAKASHVDSFALFGVKHPSPS